MSRLSVGYGLGLIVASLVAVAWRPAPLWVAALGAVVVIVGAAMEASDDDA